MSTSAELPEELAQFVTFAARLRELGALVVSDGVRRAEFATPPASPAPSPAPEHPRDRRPLSTGERERLHTLERMFEMRTELG